MKIFSYLDQMSEDLADLEWSELQSRYRELALKKAGPGYVESVQEADTGEFEEDLFETLSRAVEDAESSECLAIYLDLDIDNEWHTTFFLYKNYAPEYDHDDEWLGEWDNEIEGPSLPEYSSIYDECREEEDEEVINGVMLYLIARTLAMFGRCVDEIPSTPLAICMGIHDMDFVWRLREIEEGL